MRRRERAIPRKFAVDRSDARGMLRLQARAAYELESENDLRSAETDVDERVAEDHEMGRILGQEGEHRLGGERGAIEGRLASSRRPLDRAFDRRQLRRRFIELRERARQR